MQQIKNCSFVKNTNSLRMKTKLNSTMQVIVRGHRYIGHYTRFYKGELTTKHMAVNCGYFPAQKQHGFHFLFS